MRPIAGNFLLGVIEHGFEEAAKRSLILLRNATELLDYLVFLRTEPRVEGSLAKENETNINTQLCDSEQVGGIRISCPTLIATLSVAIHPARLSQILLAEVQPDSFFA